MLLLISPLCHREKFPLGVVKDDVALLPLDCVSTSITSDNVTMPLMTSWSWSFAVFPREIPLISLSRSPPA